jgi:DNA repair protein RecO (recombination protein O)
MSARDRIYRTEAIVLRRLDLGEADRLTTVCSQERGKLRLVAKGVRRPGSRKSGHLEPFTRVELMIARGRELDLITQAQAIDDYPGLRDDLERLGQAAYVVELLDRFTVEEGEENQALYRLLVSTLEGLNLQIQPSASIVLYFQMRLLDIVGFRPEFFQCLSCGAEIRPESQYFSSQQGGILCPRCGKKREEPLAISLNALKVMRHFQRSGFDAAVSPEISESIFLEIERIMQAYLSYLLERGLNSPEFLRRVRHIAQHSNEVN